MADNKDESKKPADTAFKQQRLPAWQPLLTPNWVIGSFAVIGLIFVIIGAVALSASSSVLEYSKQYDDCTPTNGTCLVTIEIKNEMKQPVFLYYKIEGFYQNHRRYVKSRSDSQLRGNAFTASDLSTCDPLAKNGNLLLYPCGLIANSFFNDTFTSPCIRDSATGPCTKNMTWKSDGIAWPSDKDKFKDQDISNATTTRMGVQGFELPKPSNEELMVWMRTAGLPTFKKLNRIFTSDIPSGLLTVNATNVFNVKSFGGKKSIVVSTMSWLGGKNDFLGIAYIVVGVICLLLAIGFFVKHQRSPRAFGDVSKFLEQAAPASPRGNDQKVDVK